MPRRGYPAEFRRRALDLVRAGRPVAEVARLLEVSDQSIYSWRRQEAIDRGEAPGLSTLGARGAAGGAAADPRSSRRSLRCIGGPSALLAEAVLPKGGSRRSQ